ncbi:MAG: hypothetical protein KAZ71_03340 [Bacteroidia bacterium]|nr:hypothetical protein [Bacteroidia bacterium]
MKRIVILTLIFGFYFFSCNQITTTPENKNVIENSKDTEEIKILIRQALEWCSSKNTIDLLPVQADSKDSIYIGFDMNKHKKNIDKLRETGFFAEEFIENYNQIITVLDRNLRSKEFEKWKVGDFWTFGFTNDINPWFFMCKDYTYTNPDHLAFFETEITKLDNEKGELYYGKSWAVKCRVVKENNKWKISYLEGFDFNKSTSSVDMKSR